MTKVRAEKKLYRTVSALSPREVSDQKRGARRRCVNVNTDHRPIGVCDALAFRNTDPVAARFECIHDVRVVVAAEISVRADLARHSTELGHRVLRILPGSAGEPDRLHRLFGRATQDDAGSDHARGFRGVLDDLSRRIIPMESRGRLRAAGLSGVLRVPRILSQGDAQGSSLKSLTERISMRIECCVPK